MQITRDKGLIGLILCSIPLSNMHCASPSQASCTARGKSTGGVGETLRRLWLKRFVLVLWKNAVSSFL
jgi:hypothetical protein